MQDNKLIEVEIITPQSTLFSGKAESVSVPGSKSPFQVLHNHAPIVSALDPGAVKVVNDKGELMFFAVSGGFAEVRDNKVSVLAELAIAAKDVNLAVTEAKIEELKPQVTAAKEEDRYKIEKEIKYLQTKIKIASK